MQGLGNCPFIKHEDIVISRWDSTGIFAKILSTSLILMYILGFLYIQIMPVSPETVLFVIFWPGGIFFFVVLFYVLAVIMGGIKFVIFHKQTRTEKAIYLLLPSAIIMFFTVIISGTNELLKEDV